MHLVNSNPIWGANKIYSEECKSVDQELNQSTLDKVIYPALSKRKIFIRRPRPDEQYRIMERLNETGSDWRALISNNGVLNSKEERDCILVLEAQLEGSKKSKTWGAIHYIFKSKDSDRKYGEPSFAGGKCYVESLKIHDRCKGKKFGTLLLAAAVKEASAARCRKVNLDSTSEGLDFYTAKGFTPTEVSKLGDSQWWDNASLETKIFIVNEKCFTRFSLDLSIDTIELKDDAFSAENSKRRENPSKFLIPQEAVKLGWIDPDNYDKGFIEIYDNLDIEPSEEKKIKQSEIKK